MIILIHSSKTMRTPASGTKPASTPALLDKASQLIEHLRKLTPAQLAKVMKISADLASKTKAQYET